VLFFVSVGMLFQPMVLVQEPLRVLVVVAIIMVGKTLAAIALVLAFRYPMNSALTIGASLAQIGEFSFILAGLGMALGLMPQEGHSLILAGALISIALNALLFRAIEPVQDWLRERSPLVRRLEQRDDPLAELPTSVHPAFLSGQVVLVGYGRVGRRIAQQLDEQQVRYVVAEQNRERVEELRARSVPAVSGDAADPGVLIQAHIAQAGMLVIATPDTFAARQMVETAKTLNPGIEVVLRAQSDDEATLIAQEGLGTVFVAEHALAASMGRHVLSRMGPPGARRDGH
jgi:CPA2 family monovalent cation:H+ antiporter-2